MERVVIKAIVWIHVNCNFQVHMLRSQQFIELSEVRQYVIIIRSIQIYHMGEQQV